MSYRKQFTSCDQCRKSRLGCDALNRREGSCSNCVRRSKSCSFNWIESHGRKIQRSHKSKAVEPVEPVDEPPQNTSVQITVLKQDRLWQQALTLHHVLWDIFTSLFEPQLGLWTGNDCNPFKRLTTAPKTLMSRLMVTLDNSAHNYPDPHLVQKLGFQSIVIDKERKLEEDAHINQALMSAVHAFSARWVPVNHFRKSTGESGLHEAKDIKEFFVESIWKRALQDVFPVLTRPSYRSILALYLFGITPTSSNNKDRQSGSLCLETSLRHYLHLRTESRITENQKNIAPNSNHRFDGDEANTDNVTIKSQQEYHHLVDTAYWFGIVYDTSRCLTGCQSSVLLPGLSGEKEVWDLVRNQTNNFDVIYRSMSSSTAVLTDEIVITIIQYGSSYKTLVWKTITRVQNSLFHQPSALPLETALENAIEAISRFEHIFSPLLDQCARDYLLLCEKSRISYLVLNLHYHLGVLILVDTLDCQNEAANIHPQFDSTCYRITSTRSIVNMVNLALQADAYITDNSSSILLRDPYPEHVSNGLSRAAHSILHLFHLMLIPVQTAEIMASSLFTGLEIMSQVSYSAAESLETLRRLFLEAKLVIKRRPDLPSQQLASTDSIASDSPVTPEIFEQNTVKELGLAIDDPSLVDKSIERHEIKEFPLMYAWEDLAWVDFSSVVQNWDFEDCFSST
ncbi:hypothetical protein F5884DRAFT_514072 [Xylogone sp. PMI_703]|nr:hypothetical protein F5884DRAFT_514072 [Xylogone sp. PMI_703]